MLKIKYIVFLLLLSTVIVNAEPLRTSNNLNNLEIITDTACEKQVTEAMSQAEEIPVVVNTLEVETVNYTLHGCNGDSSFPVTVRSNKRRGE